jgi:hypothetical protein
MFAMIVIAVLLTVLLGPSLVVLLLFNRVTLGEAARAAWLVWLAQVIASITLIFLADKAGLLNPAGYMLGICLLVGLAGAFVLRRQIRPLRKSN